jgi:hypothetical protein
LSLKAGLANVKSRWKASAPAARAGDCLAQGDCPAPPQRLPSPVQTVVLSPWKQPCAEPVSSFRDTSWYLHPASDIDNAQGGRSGECQIM